MNRETQLQKKKNKREGKEGREVAFFSHKTIKISVLKQPNCPAISSTNCQRKLHKIGNNWTSVCTVNLVSFPSSWYLSSQALLQPAEKPSTLFLGGGPGRRLAQISWTCFSSFVSRVLAVFFLLHKT